MNRFTVENQGGNICLVYTISDDENIDALSLGMITNNTISGILPVVYTQMDDKRYFKYTVSSKITIKQYFSALVNKKRLLGALHSISCAILAAEEYMIESTSLVLEPEYIYIDVSTFDASLVCLPVLNSCEKPVDLSTFFKNIMFSTQFDQTENCDYVAKIISYLNSTSLFSLVDFKRILNELLGGVQQQIVMPSNQVESIIPRVNAPTKKSMNLQALVINKTGPIVPTPSFVATEQSQVLDTPIPQNTPSVSMDSPRITFANPGETNVLSSLEAENIMNDNRDKEKIKKEKPQKEKKGLFSFLYKKSKSDDKSHVKEENQRTNVQQTPPVRQPTPIKNTGNAQQIIPLKSAPIQSSKINFGETVVLGAQKPGETSVLGGGEALLAKPYIIRCRNNEKIYIDKPLFIIGKDKSDVDYCITDNSAVSRSHANIITRSNNYYVVDKNSTNHTYVNGVMIQSNIEVKIVHATKLRFANEEFEFRLYL